jgi:hypothetical protein
MEKIPVDIIINHIIPYTYFSQPKNLLEDITNYYEIKKILMDENLQYIMEDGWFLRYS